eukprot:UN22614
MGFEYGVNYGAQNSMNRVGSYVAGDCQPQNSANYEFCEGSRYNLDFYLKDSGCTEDAMICPDGSMVTRDSENNCEFFPCQTTTTMSGGNALGDMCGYVFGMGDVGDCAEGLVCACVGACADPFIADYPSTCVEEGYTTAGPS